VSEAVANGHADMVACLAKFGLPLDVKDPMPLTHIAAARGFPDVLQVLSDYGAQLDIEVAVVAASSGQVGVIDKLQQLGVSMKDFHGEYVWSPLSHAVCNGHVEIVQKLMSLGATVRNVNRSAWTDAAFFGHDVVLKELANCGMPVAAQCAQWLAHLAMCSGNAKRVLEVCAEMSAPLNIIDSGGLMLDILKSNRYEGPTRWTPWGRTKFSRLLDVWDSALRMELDWRGLAPAHIAACMGDIEALLTLHAHDSLLGVVCENHGGTPAHYAAMRGNLAALKALWKLDVPVDAPDMNGDTPAKWASSHNQQEVVDWLAEAVKENSGVAGTPADVGDSVDPGRKAGICPLPVVDVDASVVDVEGSRTSDATGET